MSLLLAVAAFVLASIPGTPLKGGVPDFPFMDSAFFRLVIEVSLGMSAICFLTGSIERWCSGAAVAGLTFGLVAIIGVVVFVYSLIYGVRVSDPDGVVVTYQSVPQSLYLVIWSIFGLVLLPFARLIRRGFAPFPEETSRGAEAVPTSK
ncbi:MAG: hypothetical protein ACREB9_02555 [Thermoplasmata archaeon]